MENKPTFTERLWKWVTGAMALAGLAGWIWSTNLYYVYQRTLPRQPDPAIGRIYPLNIYGPEVYLTRKEQDSLYRRQWSSAAIAVLGVLLYRLSDKKFWESL